MRGSDRSKTLSEFSGSILKGNVLTFDGKFIKFRPLSKTTEQQYYEVIENCKDIFIKKTKDYGTAWRILRLPSITDQIYIKTKRIRSIQEKGSQKVEDSILSEFIGIINYCVISLIQIGLTEEDPVEMDVKKVNELYDREVKTTFDLLMNKNHDYGEAWRDMRVSSITLVQLFIQSMCSPLTFTFQCFCKLIIFQPDQMQHIQKRT